MVAYKGSLFVFGGYDSNGFLCFFLANKSEGAACDDMFKFDLSTHTWHILEKEGCMKLKPAPRYQHCAALTPGSDKTTSCCC